MSRKICLACHAPLSEGAAECSVCGNPDYIVPNMDADKLKKIQKWADDHRKAKLEGIEIGILTYSHEMKDNKLVQKEVTTTKVCGAADISFEHVVWLSEKFARIDTDRNLGLTVVISRGGKQIKKKEISFKAPDLKDFWYVGAQLTEGLGVSLVVGNDSVNVKLESIALLG